MENNYDYPLTLKLEQGILIAQVSHGLRVMPSVCHSCLQQILWAIGHEMKKVTLCMGCLKSLHTEMSLLLDKTCFTIRSTRTEGGVLSLEYPKIP